jgi:GNAT superfamily N-acetyltransferase
MSASQASQDPEFPYTISPARTPADIEAIRSLLKIYSYGQREKQAAVLTAESASLPGRFSPPHGEMLLARANFSEQEAIGWIGLRPFPALSDPQAEVCNTNVCEAKRLYVVEKCRGWGIGKAIMREVMRTAKEKGFIEMRISVERMLEKEIKMYKRWGFLEIDKYFESVLPGLNHLVYLSFKL